MDRPLIDLSPGQSGKGRTDAVRGAAGQPFLVSQVILDGNTIVGNPTINLPFQDGLYNPFLVILGTVQDWVYHVGDLDQI